MSDNNNRSELPAATLGMQPGIASSNSQSSTGFLQSFQTSHVRTLEDPFQLNRSPAHFPSTPPPRDEYNDFPSPGSDLLEAFDTHERSFCQPSDHSHSATPYTSHQPPVTARLALIEEGRSSRTPMHYSDDEGNFHQDSATPLNPFAPPGPSLSASSVSQHTLRGLSYPPAGHSLQGALQHVSHSETHAVEDASASSDRLQPTPALASIPVQAPPDFDDGCLDNARCKERHAVATLWLKSDASF